LTCAPLARARAFFMIASHTRVSVLSPITPPRGSAPATRR
jgi:hypothetical protein